MSIIMPQIAFYQLINELNKYKNTKNANTSKNDKIPSLWLLKLDKSACTHREDNI